MRATFLSASDISGFKKWSAALSLPANQDEDPAGGATPVALSVPVPDAPVLAAAEQPHRPWLVHGMRSAL